jgi:hypothetical protein
MPMEIERGGGEPRRESDRRPAAADLSLFLEAERAARERAREGYTRIPDISRSQSDFDFDWWFKFKWGFAPWSPLN